MSKLKDFFEWMELHECSLILDVDEDPATGALVPFWVITNGRGIHYVGDSPMEVFEATLRGKAGLF